VCRRPLLFWSTTRVLDIRGARPPHDFPTWYTARGAAYQLDDGALRKQAASEWLRPQVFLIVACLRKSLLFGSIQFLLASEFHRAAIDGQYEVVAGEERSI